MKGVRVQVAYAPAEDGMLVATLTLADAAGAPVIITDAMAALMAAYARCACQCEAGDSPCPVHGEVCE